MYVCCSACNLLFVVNFGAGRAEAELGVAVLVCTETCSAGGATDFIQPRQHLHVHEPIYRWNFLIGHVLVGVNLGEFTSSYILHTRAFGTCLLRGLFTLQKKL